MAAVNPASNAGQQVTLTPFFKLVFITVLGLTLLSLLVSLGLSVYVVRLGKQSVDLADVKGIIETCSTTFKLGFGAIVGLIGGKAIQ